MTFNYFSKKENFDFSNLLKIQKFLDLISKFSKFLFFLDERAPMEIIATQQDFMNYIDHMNNKQWSWGLEWRNYVKGNFL